MLLQSPRNESDKNNVFFDQIFVRSGLVQIEIITAQRRYVIHIYLNLQILYDA